MEPTPSRSDEEDSESYPVPDSEDVRHSVQHVCIQQLHRATRKHTDALFEIHGKQFKQAIIVGNVCGRKQLAGHISYEIDDGTGRIQAKFWQEPTRPEDDPLGEETSKLLYVRAVGELNDYYPPSGMKFRSLTLQRIRCVEDYHAIEYHTLQVITETLIACNGPPPLNSTGGTEVAKPEPLVVEDAEIMKMTSNLADSSLRTPTKVKNARSKSPPISPLHSARARKASEDVHAGTSRHQLSPRRDQTNQSSTEQSISMSSSRSDPSTRSSGRGNLTDDPYKDLNTLQRDVLLVINSHIRGEYPSIYPRLSPSYEGVHRDEIVRQVVRQRKGCSPDTVQRAISELAEQAYIYSTVDDDHFGVV